MADNKPVAVGELRDPIQFYNVTDVIDTTTKRSVKNFSYSGNDWGCIRPTGTQQFYEGYNTESGVTHTIYTRYRSDANAYKFIVQSVTLPDTSAAQTINYEIIRATDWNGRRIYSRFDCRMIAKV